MLSSYTIILHIHAGLLKFNEFSIVVAARTLIGIGPYSTPITVKTLEDSKPFYFGV